MLGYVLLEADAKTGFDMKRFTGVIICEGNSGERERERERERRLGEPSDP